MARGWPFRPGTRAFTIVETIWALVLMAAAILVAGRMFQTALRISALSRDESLVLLVCEQRLRAVQAWSRQRGGNGGYNFNGSWPDGVNDQDACDGAVPTPVVAGAPDLARAPFLNEADADNPCVAVGVRAWRHVLHTPARGLKGDLAMTDSARIVRVDASWGGTSWVMRPRALSLVAVVPEPPRQLTALDVTPQPTDLGVDDVADFTATGRDATGPMTDGFFRFYLWPVDGNATIRTLSQNQVRVMGFVTYPNGTRYATGGSCKMSVRGMCDGREWWARPAVRLRLGGPEGPLVGPAPGGTP